MWPVLADVATRILLVIECYLLPISGGNKTKNAGKQNEAFQKLH